MLNYRRVCDIPWNLRPHPGEICPNFFRRVDLPRGGHRRLCARRCTQFATEETPRAAEFVWLALCQYCLMWRSSSTSVESSWWYWEIPWASQVNYRGNPKSSSIRLFWYWTPWAKSPQVAVADGTVFIASYLGVSKRRRLLNHNDKTFSISSLNSQFQGSLLAKLDCARWVWRFFRSLMQVDRRCHE